MTEEPGRDGELTRNLSVASSTSSRTTSKARRTTAPATAPGAVHATTEEPGRDGELTRNLSVASSTSSQTSSKGRRTTAPATVPGAVHATAEEPGRDGELTRNLSVASSTSSQTSSKGRRTTAPATAPGAVHAAAEEPGRDGELTPRSSSKILVPQSGKGRRSTAQAALVPGAVAVENVEPRAASDATHSQNASPAQQRSLASFDRSVGAMPLGALPPRASQSPPTAVAADMRHTNAAYEPVMCPGAAGSHSVEATGLVDAPDTLSNADTTLASNSTMTASQDSADKDRDARGGKPSVPGAHHVAATQEDSPDSIAMVKDPRMRHEAQQLGGDSVKSRMAARAEKVAATEKEASPMIGAGQSEPSNQNVSLSRPEDDGYKSLRESEVKVTTSQWSGDAIPERSRSIGVMGRSPVIPLDGVKDPYDDPYKSPVDEEQPSMHPMSNHAAAVAAALTTESRGIGGAPDVAYGTAGGGSNDLAVAVAIPEDEDQPFFPAAVEYDPDSKPPLLKNRRFRLYAISGFVLFVIIIVTVILAVVVFKKSPGYGSSDAPSLAPTSTSDAQYFQQFALAHGHNDWDFASDSPQGRAAQWIIDEDERDLGADHATLTQRYLLAVFYFTTTQNGVLPWRSCNPDPLDSAITACEYERYTIDGETVKYVPEASFRWLSKEDECIWAGVICNDVSVTMAIDLSKCFAKVEYFVSFLWEKPCFLTYYDFFVLT